MKQRCLKRAVVLVLPPLLIAGYYYAVAPKFDFWLKEGPLGLLSASIAKDRLFIIGLPASYWMVSLVGPLSRSTVRPIADVDPVQKRAGLVIALTVSMIVANMAFLAMLWIRQTMNQAGFQISNRYFMGLKPVGIVAVTFAAYYFMQVPQNKAVKWVLFLLVTAIVLGRFQRKFGLIVF